MLQKKGRGVISKDLGTRHSTGRKYHRTVISRNRFDSCENQQDTLTAKTKAANEYCNRVTVRAGTAIAESVK